jgi:tRNA nucleotidyltransferase (CCA-adding enzyme)
LTAEVDHVAMFGIVDRLSIPPRFRRILEEEREHSHQSLKVMERRRARHRAPQNSELHHWLEPFSVEILLYLMARTSNDEIRQWISLFFTQLRKITPYLTGNDLKEMGVPPGPAYKEILSALLDARLNGRVLTREDEITLVRKRFLKTSARNPSKNSEGELQAR